MTWNTLQTKMFCQVYYSNVTILADLFSYLFHFIILGSQQKSWKKYTFAYFYINSMYYTAYTSSA